MTPERAAELAADARRMVPLPLGDLNALDAAIQQAILSACNEQKESIYKTLYILPDELAEKVASTTWDSKAHIRFISAQILEAIRSAE